jgi:selenium metabolism protein YedF
MKSTVILVTKDGIGTAPEDLSKTLVKNYFGILKDEKKIPSAILFYGEGVKLVCEGSEVIDSLKTLETRGVKLIACKTCLNYFSLANQIKAGEIGTMADIIAYQIEADKVITL